MSVDLSKMSHKELETLQEDVKSAIKSAFEARKAAEKAAAEYGFSLDEVSGGARKTKQSKTAAKYANPSDRTQTWTGKGRQPNWFRELVNNGTPAETLEV